MKYQEVIDSLVAEIRRLEDEYGPADAFGVTHRLLHAAEDLKFAEKSRVRLATPIDLRAIRNPV